ncbi:ABC transporter permease [Castellaniella hirudinis]|uniref:ABC transporter permease n=1 Tax=Castellaniella hirudinis TaxID=1144617 RepID=UPI0039C05DAF
MMFYGYGANILQGTTLTFGLLVVTTALSLMIGILGAVCKLSRLAALRGLATLYTTAIRAVPDLVLMLLIFFNLQIMLNAICDALGLALIEIDAFSAGVVTLSFIYGAYMTETFRGAIRAVPRGQLEAARSTGMSGPQIFRMVTFPQMMRHALPGLNNNIQVIIKATALVSIIGLTDLISITQQAGQATQKNFFFSLLAAAIYLIFTTVTLYILSHLDRKFSRGVREGRI